MLPENGTAWPLAGHATELAHMAEWSAWYSGDPDQLQSFYQAASRGTARTRPSQHAGGVAGKLARWWWGQPVPDGERRAKLHVPLAADICGTSADLLFSEPVQLSVEGKDKRLQEFLTRLQEQGLDTQLHEAAEVTAALGGGYLRTVWDRDRQRDPWTDVVHADMGLPEFRWGQLVAVTFWQVLPPQGGEQVVWRLMERHSPGRITHALYAGKADNVGRQVPLTEHPDAEPLAELVDADGGYDTNTKRLTATYVPNMHPNRRNRGSQQGRSDLQGVEPFLDALDEAYSSWWRDIRHAKARIHAPRQYLESGGPGEAGAMDLDREVYVAMDGVLAKGGDRMLLDAQQFAIRVAEHAQTCKDWTERIIESAGYSTQSLSSGAGGAVTAAEVHSHERRSYMTRGKKVRYWRQALLDHLQTQVEVANGNLSAGLPPGDLRVHFQDGVQESAMSLAQTAMAMRNAEAASTATRVRIMHPEWDDTQVQAEVDAILAETGGAEPMPEDAGL